MSMTFNRKSVTPLILHSHIPKTAGTTVSVGFRRSFEFFHIHHYHLDPFYVLTKDKLETLLEINPRLRSISSHHLRSFPFSIGGRPTFLLTFLRRPEDAFISQLRYVQRNYWLFPHAWRALWPKEAPLLTLRELARQYLDQESATQDLCPQTRFICNPDAGALFGLSDGNQNGLNSYAMAHQILSGFHFVGIVEEMKKSLEVLADRLWQWGTKVYFDYDLRLNTSPETSRPAWLTPEDEVGRRVLVASENDVILYDFFRKKLLESHRDLRKRRWLGLMQATTDAKEAFGDSWSAGVRSLFNSARLYWSRRTDPIKHPALPPLSADLLEVRAAEAVANRQIVAGLLP
jgi:hypothetical protein